MSIFKFNAELFNHESTFPHRLIYQGGGVDKAPPSPEQFKSPEKQSMQDRLNEVSAQSPSQIFNDTISAGGAVKTRYTQNTTILAGLANDNPLGGGGGSGASSTTTTTTATTATTTTTSTETPSNENS